MLNRLLLTIRFISQRQYKRKLRRDCPSYATLQRTHRRSSTKSVTKNGSEKTDDADEVSKEREAVDLEGSDTLRKMKIMSKTTFKLRTFEDSEETPDLSLELMEIPLSPTHYQSPPTPDHEPPNPFEAETRIQAVIDQIRIVSFFKPFVLFFAIVIFVHFYAVFDQIRKVSFCTLYHFFLHMYNFIFGFKL